ncbi:type IV secretion protein Rhs [Erwinia typographi]|uniref:Type IV secretion protein Rhs n=1 Tax=Erwinia typographi TaxID=371042 RepID=A0A0A3ZRM4_9GAMM|nr:polymorphic toxin type 46 domain-containing protein [Erwinia typographi]KGT88343.1 type IV secretion protein Rhs [Erwinia typographi]
MSSSTEPFAAAREGDGIEHTASKGWLVVGLIGGAIAGAAFTLVTGGVGTAVLAATIAGAAGGGGLGEVLGSMSWAPTHETGRLTAGSPNVFINGRPAIMAHASVGECDEHGPAPQLVAEGSSRVYINGLPAARTGDLLTCSAAISEGSPNVFIGGEKVQTDPISPEIPDWVNSVLLGVGLAASAVLAGPAVALLGLAGGMGGGYAGAFIGGRVYGEGSDGQKWLALGGSFAGGIAGARAGMKWNAGSGVKAPAVSERRAYLNEKFGRTGDINRDINIRSNTETVTNFMKEQGVPENKIPEYMEGINLDERVSVESINSGKLAYQNQSPGNWQGNWYSLNENTPPTKLGINPEGNLRGTEIKVPKVTTAFESQQPVEMLRSTATPALDTWSVPKEPFQTEGGGVQWFSTNKDAWIPKK